MTTATLTDAATITLAFPLAAAEGLRHAITLALPQRPTSERDMLASIYGALVNPQPAPVRAASATVDVLAVMDALVESTARVAAGGTVTADPHTVEVAKRTRAAIAELIEAAREASATLGHVYHTTPLPPKLEQYAHDGYQRLDAALARVSSAGGAK